MLASLLPAGVATAELRSPANPESLLDGEKQDIGRAAECRVREFAAGRLCARHALAQLGVRGFALRRGDNGVPLWPAGIVGSITHTQGFCGAVAALSHDVRGIGIDAESAARLGCELWPRIATPEELAWLQSLSAHQAGAAAALIFAAKEAYYKCQFAVTGEWLDFHDVELVSRPRDLRAGMLAMRRRRQPSAEGVELQLNGRFAFDRDLVLAAFALTAD